MLIEYAISGLCFSHLHLITDNLCYSIACRTAMCYHLKNGNRWRHLCDNLHPDDFCLSWVVVGPSRMFFPNSIVNARARLRANLIINSSPVLENGCVGEDYVLVDTCPLLASGIRVGLLSSLGSTGVSKVLGPGPLVVQGLAPQTTVMGLPTRLYRAGNFRITMLKAEL